MLHIPFVIAVAARVRRAARLRAGAGLLLGLALTAAPLTLAGQGAPPPAAAATPRAADHAAGRCGRHAGA